MTKKVMVFVLVLSFFAILLPKAKAVEFNPLPSPLLVEYYTDHVDEKAESWSWIQRSYIQNSENSFFALNYHGTDPLGSRENYDRNVSFNKVKVVPAITINGTKLIGGAKNSTWPSEIKKATEDKRYPVQIDITIIAPNRGIIKFLSSENLSKRKLNFNIVLFEDWVNFRTKIDETTHRNLVRGLPLGPTGEKITLKQNTIIEKSFVFPIKVKDVRKNLMGIVGFVQDMDTHEILGTGLYRFSNEEPVYFNWNHWPKNFVDHNKKTLPECKTYIGLQSMVFSGEKMKDIKKISFSIFYGNEERKYYEILGVKKLYPNCDIVFRRPSTVEITFETPISGNKDIFEFIVDNYKATGDDWAVSFKVENFQVFDIKNEAPRYDINNIQLYYTAQMQSYPNPMDFNDDKIVDYDDIDLLLPFFGLNSDDFDYEEIYNVDNTDNLNRIDIRDLVAIILYIRDQELLLKSIE